MKRAINKIKESITFLTVSVASSYLVFELVSSFLGAKLGLCAVAIIVFSVLFKLSE